MYIVCKLYLCGEKKLENGKKIYTVDPNTVWKQVKFQEEENENKMNANDEN